MLPPGPRIGSSCSPRDQLSIPEVSSKSGQWRPDWWQTLPCMGCGKRWWRFLKARNAIEKVPGKGGHPMGDTRFWRTGFETCWSCSPWNMPNVTNRNGLATLCVGGGWAEIFALARHGSRSPWCSSVARTPCVFTGGGRASRARPAAGAAQSPGYFCCQFCV